MSCNSGQPTFESLENITELQVAADGRLFVFGASSEVLVAILAGGIADPALSQRLTAVQQATGLMAEPPSTCRCTHDADECGSKFNQPTLPRK